MEYSVRLPRGVVMGFDEFRLNRPPFRFRWMTYRLDEKNMIYLHDSGEWEEDGEPQDFSDFLDALPRAQCTLGIYNHATYNEDGDETSRTIAFVSWAPLLASMESKAQYHEAKVLMHKGLLGIQVHIHANSKDELSLDIVERLAASGAYLGGRQLPDKAQEEDEPDAQ
eukprot:g426.t1